MPDAESLLNYHKHHDAMCFTKGGDLLLGSSNLTGRYWTGCLTLYPKSSPSTIQKDPPSASLALSSGVTDVKWVSDSNNFIATCDSGSAGLYELLEDGAELMCRAEVKCHDHLISSSDLNSNSFKLLTASFDRSVRIWDVAEFYPSLTYTGHTAPVLSVSCHKKSAEVFLSCSQDGSIVLWDVRKPKPASIVQEAGSSLACCVAWCPDSEHGFIVGTECGRLELWDQRGGAMSETSGVVAKISPHTRAVRRVAFSNDTRDWIAVASEDCTVSVVKFEGETASIVYTDDSHKDMVQDVAWNPVDHSLYSCSWDSRVIARDVTETSDSQRITSGISDKLERGGGDMVGEVPA